MGVTIETSGTFLSVRISKGFKSGMKGSFRCSDLLFGWSVGSFACVVSGPIRRAVKDVKHCHLGSAKLAWHGGFIGALNSSCRNFPRNVCLTSLH